MTMSKMMLSLVEQKCNCLGMKWWSIAISQLQGSLRDPELWLLCLNSSTTINPTNHPSTFSFIQPASQAHVHSTIHCPI